MPMSVKVLRRTKTCKDRACVNLQVGEYQGAYKVMQHNLTFLAAAHALSLLCPFNTRINFGVSSSHVGK